MNCYARYSRDSSFFDFPTPLRNVVEREGPFMSVSIQNLVNKFPDLFKILRGNGETKIDKMQAASLAKTSDIIFVNTPQLLKESLGTKSEIWVVHQDLTDLVPSSVPHLLSSENAQLAMAKAAREFFPQKEHLTPVDNIARHPGAHIAASAQIGENCVVGPGAVIGNNVRIGNDSVIGANAVLEPGVVIGARTHIHPLVFIAFDCQIGSDCEILPHTTIGSQGYGFAQDKNFNHHAITHFGRVVIEDSVYIGASVQIDRGTFLDSRIGQGTKIDNHCHFGHNIQIGKNTLITGGMITAGSVTIGSYCVFGGRTTIKGHISICDQARFGGLSAISNNVTKPGEYGGFPLQEIKHELRTRAVIRNLPEMAKKLNRVLKHLGMNQE
jgi:UDP-3-O-[3-hydroxymyristoyl] glucosamine N-acyltransferase